MITGLERKDTGVMEGSLRGKYGPDGIDTRLSSHMMDISILISISNQWQSEDQGSRHPGRRIKQSNSGSPAKTSRYSCVGVEQPEHKQSLLWSGKRAKSWKRNDDYSSMFGRDVVYIDRGLYIEYRPWVNALIGFADVSAPTCSPTPSGHLQIRACPI